MIENENQTFIAKHKNYLICNAIIIITLLLILKDISFIKGSNNTEGYILENYEKELLYNLAITETEQNRIESGDLTYSQQQDLTTIRNLNSYLEKKYPSYNCTIEYISARGLFLSTIECGFTVQGFSKTYFAFSEDNENFSDDFYGELYSSDYSNMIKSKIEDNNNIINIIAINTNFYSSVGNEVKEGLTISELCDLKISNDVKIYINSENNDSLEEIKNRIKKLGLYGSYTIYNSELFKSGMTALECDGIWSDKKSDIEYITFNSWNW